MSDLDQELINQLELYNRDFFDLCEERHNQGAKEYGPLNFLDVDLIEFILEEVADIANYARFMYIRIKMLEEAARERGINLSTTSTGEVPTDEVSFGSSSFVSQGKISGFLPDKE